NATGAGAATGPGWCGSARRRARAMGRARRPRARRRASARPRRTPAARRSPWGRARRQAPGGDRARGPPARPRRRRTPAPGARRASIGADARQRVPLEPGVGDVLLAVVRVADGGHEVGVDGVDDDGLRGPHAAEDVVELAVIGDLEQAPAVRVELAFHAAVA